MTNNNIGSIIKSILPPGIRIEPEGTNKFRVFTPFMFDHNGGDGDHYVIVLKLVDNKWILTDEGHTLMHFADLINDEIYGLIIKGIPALTDNGELVLEIKDSWQNAIEYFRIKIGQIELLAHKKIGGIK